MLTARNIRSSRQWFVATTRWNQELKAERELRKRDFRPFNPRIRETSIERGRKKLKLSQYISGYIFVLMDAGREPWWKVNSTPGIRQLMLTADGRLARIPAATMEPLLALAPDGYLDEEAADEILLAPGELIKAKEGPFAGHNGEIEAVRRTLSDMRVIALFRLFGRETRVEMAAADVERA